MQVYHDSEEGKKYRQFYKVNEWPYVAVLDPRTGTHIGPGQQFFLKSVEFFFPSVKKYVVVLKRTVSFAQKNCLLSTYNIGFG